MERSRTYDRYPIWIVLVCTLVSWMIYAVGGYVLARVWIWLVVPYLVYSLWLELRLLRVACADCGYYGRLCAFGKGKLCALALKRGDTRRFSARDISWAHMIPDLLVSLIPLLFGTGFLVLTGWDWLIGGLLFLLVILASGVTGAVRGSLACRYCRQRELGCPAYALFGGRTDA